jgi:hypothetical protein
VDISIECTHCHEMAKAAMSLTGTREHAAAVLGRRRRLYKHRHGKLSVVFEFPAGRPQG